MRLRQGFQAAEVSSSMVYGRGPQGEVSEPSRRSPSCGSKLCHGIRRLQHLLHLRRLHQLPASTGRGRVRHRPAVTFRSMDPVRGEGGIVRHAQRTQRMEFRGVAQSLGSTPRLR